MEHIEAVSQLPPHRCLLASMSTCWREGAGVFWIAEMNHDPVLDDIAFRCDIF